MVTLLIMGLLITLGSSVTKRWVDNTHQHEAKTLLEQAITRAQAIALRNPNNALGNNPVVALCLDEQTNNLLVVQQPDNANTVDCSPSNLWSSPLPKGIVIKHAEQLFKCIAWNNRGLITDSNQDNCINSEDLLQATTLSIYSEPLPLESNEDCTDENSVCSSIDLM